MLGIGLHDSDLKFDNKKYGTSTARHMDMKNSCHSKENEEKKYSAYYECHNRL